MGTFKDLSKTFSQMADQFQPVTKKKMEFIVTDEMPIRTEDRERFIEACRDYARRHGVEDAEHEQRATLAEQCLERQGLPNELSDVLLTTYDDALERVVLK